MKIAVIGDIHGSTLWKKILEQEKDYDKLVFIGDYFDTFDKVSAVEQIYNFKKIVSVKKDEPDKVVLLTGNHDAHYMEGFNQQYSGFQYKDKWEIGLTLDEEREHLQMCYSQDAFLFSHAGVTNMWCDDHGVKVDKDIAASINALPITSFRFKYKGLSTSPYGDNIYQSPIWVRPMSLQVASIEGFTQIVGHTQMPKITWYHPDVIVVDALPVGEYLVIEDLECKAKHIK